MKKKLILLTSIFTLFSCGETNTSLNNEKNFILTGNLDLGDKKEITLSENNNFTYNNLILRRGDSFTISSLSFDNLDDSKGFYKGNNNYINVLNEGIYNLKIDNNTIYLTKNDSSYKNVELIYLDSSKEKVSLTKNNDFSYSIDNVPLRNREGFYIALDEEKLAFSDLEYNETYYNAFKFDNENIITKAKGNFNFKIDFSLAQPLIITSDNLTLPNIIADDLPSYELLKNNVIEQIHSFSKSMTLKENIKEEENESKYSYIQKIDTNQNYYEKTNLATKEKEIQVQLYNDKNYFDIINYENSTLKGRVNGKVLGTKEEKAKTDSSIITTDKEYILQNDAYNKVHSIFGIEYNINNALNSLIEPKHLTNLTTNEKENYKNSLEVQTTYLNDYGDIIKVNAKNIEKNSSQYIVNNLELIINDQKDLTSAKLETFEYSADDIIVNDNNIILKDDAKEIKSTILEYEFSYSERTTLTTFDIDLNKCIARDITCLDTIDLSLGDTLPLDKIAPIGYAPTTAIDVANYKIISYDSAYFYKNYNGSLSANKMGSTSIKVGNTYNDVYFDINININYKAPTSLTIKDSRSDYQPTYYVNETYTFNVTPSNNSDPAIKVYLGTNQDEFASIESVSSDEEARKNGKATFTIKTIKATDKLDLIVKSKANNSITSTITIKVQSPLDLSTISGNYYYSGDLSNYIKLKSDGTGVLKGKKGDKEEHSFTYKIENSKLMLVNSSTLSNLVANIEAYPDSINGYSLYKIEAYTTNAPSTNLFDKYNRYTSLDDSNANLFNNSYKNNDNVTLTFDLTTKNYDSYFKYFSCEAILYIDEETILKFKITSNYTISGSIYIKNLNSEDDEYNYTSKFDVKLISHQEDQQFTFSVNNSTYILDIIK